MQLYTPFQCAALFFVAWAFSGEAEKGFWFPVGDLRQISEALVSEGFFLKTP